MLENKVYLWLKVGEAVVEAAEDVLGVEQHCYYAWFDAKWEEAAKNCRLSRGSNRSQLNGDAGLQKDGKKTVLMQEELGRRLMMNYAK